MNRRVRGHRPVRRSDTHRRFFSRSLGSCSRTTSGSQRAGRPHAASQALDVEHETKPGRGPLCPEPRVPILRQSVVGRVDLQAAVPPASECGPIKPPLSIRVRSVQLQVPLCRSGEQERRDCALPTCQTSTCRTGAIEERGTRTGSLLSCPAPVPASPNLRSLMARAPESPLRRPLWRPKVESPVIRFSARTLARPRLSGALRVHRSDSARPIGC